LSHADSEARNLTNHDAFHHLPRMAHRYAGSSTHLNPVPGWVSRPENWRCSSYSEYAGISTDEQNEPCGLITDCLRMPSGIRTHELDSLSWDRKDVDLKSRGPRCPSLAKAGWRPGSRSLASSAALEITMSVHRAQ
jgi:hypothetical protein